ncbi:MAG: hypothetical protein KAI66_04605 [Lentisphaeria bacterium]|nr:hypothetical protein [Lentisphaeria bacterium]
MDPFLEDVSCKSPERIETEFANFQRLYANELETYLAGRCTGAGVTWHRDYGSVEAYLTSTAPNRQAWRQVLGCFEMDEVLEPAVCTRPFHDGDDYTAEWVSFEFLPGVVSRAVVALPRKTAHAKPPVVICQHGIGSSPFHVFGHINPSSTYGQYGKALLAAGFAVVAPVNRTTGPGRNRLERLAHLCGTTLFGLECFKLEKLIDHLETRDDMDASRLGMSGISLGGTATLMFTPVIERIKAACCIAWFNDRRKKMVVPDPRYSCFLETGEEHAFVPGWLPEFSDSDLVSLICPRPFMSQTGKADGISWWPFVEDEWKEAKAHYDRLGIGERAELVLHDSGHEVVPSKTIEFFAKWL